MKYEYIILCHQLNKDDIPIDLVGKKVCLTDETARENLEKLILAKERHQERFVKERDEIIEADIERNRIGELDQKDIDELAVSG